MLTVGGTPVNHESEREMYREAFDPHYAQEKSDVARADYYANLRRFIGNDSWRVPSDDGQGQEAQR